jgi:PadR family transcriptional regulator, regulatory protein PadR
LNRISQAAKAGCDEQGDLTPVLCLGLAIHHGSMYKRSMNKKRTNPAFLNGVPELLMLHLLLGRPMYGYELVQAIKTATDQEFAFGEGCVYPILHRLEADGLLKASRETTAGRSRVVYRVTPKGKKHLAETLTCWQRVVGAVNLALQGGGYGEAALA